MSSGYASRLSEYKNKGVCGLPEVFDSPRALTIKIHRLVELMKQASQVVVITGAGISTSAGIPDFRGPKGIWTKQGDSIKQQQQPKQEQQQQQPVQEEPQPSASSSSSDGTMAHRKRKRTNYHHPTKSRHETKEVENFADAQPTICHRAITKLVMHGKIKYCITQNVDGLHRRAGLSRDYHCSVHGCVFTERCERCGAEYFRDFDVGGMSFQPTGRYCTLCVDDTDTDTNQEPAKLCDTLLDWEDPLPESDFDRAQDEVQVPGTLVLCLGTSLRIEPVGSLPLEADKYVIVNLQKTPIDEGAALVIRGPVDHVMDQVVIQWLQLPQWKEETPPPIERIWKPTNNTTETVSTTTKTTAAAMDHGTSMVTANAYPPISHTSLTTEKTRLPSKVLEIEHASIINNDKKDDNEDDAPLGIKSDSVSNHPSSQQEADKNKDEAKNQVVVEEITATSPSTKAQNEEQLDNSDVVATTTTTTTMTRQSDIEEQCSNDDDPEVVFMKTTSPLATPERRKMESAVVKPPVEIVDLIELDTDDSDR